MTIVIVYVTVGDLKKAETLGNNKKKKLASVKRNNVL
jgi:hypothetical protein